MPVLNGKPEGSGAFSTVGAKALRRTRTRRSGAQLSELKTFFQRISVLLPGIFGNMQDVFVFRFPQTPVNTATHQDGFIRHADDRPREFPARPLDGIPPPDRFRTDIRDDTLGPIEVKETLRNDFFTLWPRPARRGSVLCEAPLSMHAALRPELAFLSRE